ncbi:hypothetical protein HDU76_005255, partial [Blyttiomyces sp. JEL0837]
MSIHGPYEQVVIGNPLFRKYTNGCRIYWVLVTGKYCAFVSLQYLDQLNISPVQFLVKLAEMDPLSGGVEAASSGYVTSFVSKYIRNLALDSDTFSQVVSKLGNGIAFTETEFMAAMIDIAGYSKFTSALTNMGKISSEILTEAVGKFLNDIVDVVDRHDGHILKFL